MNKHLIENLEAGTYFTKPVYLDSNYILLTPDTPFSEALKSRLNSWGYHHVLSDGDTTSEAAPGTAGAAGGSDGDGDALLVAHEQGRKDTEYLNEATEYYQSVLSFTEQLFTNFISKNQLPERSVTDQIKDLIDVVKSRRKYMLNFRAFPTSNKNYIVEHSVKATVLSIAVGATLKLPPHRLIELGTASLLHEIGMLRLPPQLYMSDKQLSGQEKKAITAHTLLGFKILKGFSFPMSVCLGVLECREHLDGSGYPRGIGAERISLYAKIINATSSFAAMISKRPFRGAKGGHNAILELLQQRGTVYDETVLRALVANLSIYPIGSYVQLANGYRGIVVEPSEDNPRAPHVRVMMHANGDRYQEQPTVKTTDQEYRVVRALNDEEINELNQEA
jgi:HD-GYP domain-containing protein (c-di-GMP phosphodiesterase class II)